MAQMLIDGGLTDTEAKGYLTKSETIAEMQFHYFTTDRWC
jgi:hypothetical protein